jgi:hypothetical protein
VERIFSKYFKRFEISSSKEVVSILQRSTTYRKQRWLSNRFEVSSPEESRHGPVVFCIEQIILLLYTKISFKFIHFNERVIVFLKEMRAGHRFIFDKIRDS